MNWLSKMGLVQDGHLSLTSVCLLLLTTRIVVVSEWSTVAALFLIVANYVHRRHLLFLSRKVAQEGNGEILKKLEDFGTQLSGVLVSQGFGVRRT